jgi:hypothetical protein
MVPYAGMDAAASAAYGFSPDPGTGSTLRCWARMESAMKKFEDYRAHADECRSLANRAPTPENKDLLMNMAATWESLGPHIDRLARENRTAPPISIDRPNASNDE